MTLAAAQSLSIEQRIAMDAADAEALADRLREKYSENVRRRIRVSAQHNLRASSLGMKCDRRLYNDVKHWQDQSPVDEVVQKYFDRGNDLEPVIQQKLYEMGLRVIEQQRDLFDPELRIGAHIDGMALLAEDESGRRVTVEIKASVNSSLMACTSVEALKANKWGKRYYVQCQIYMKQSQTYATLLVMWDAAAWEPVILVIPFDPFDYEEIANRARRINGHIDRNEPPDYTTDSRECRLCPHFGRSCSPPVSFGRGAQILTDEELLAEIEEREKLTEAGKKYNKLDASIKARLKGDKDNPQDGIFIIGPYEIHREVQNRAAYDIPTEVKERYRRPGHAVKIEIERVA